MLKMMKPEWYFVDVAIDQGGCLETSHPTTHSETNVCVDGIVHYAVANIPWCCTVYFHHGTDKCNAERLHRMPIGMQRLETSLERSGIIISAGIECGRQSNIQRLSRCLQARMGGEL